MRRFLVAAAAVAMLCDTVARSATAEALARDIFQQLIEINTTDDTTAAAEAMAARLRTAGFAQADVQVLGPNPRKGNLVARYRGAGVRRPLLLLAHLDVVPARRQDWSVDPFAFVEKGGHFYGRGASDDKAMASILAANFIRLRQEGFAPDRDLILALTADEESGRFNGVEWLLKEHPELLDAALAINEGGSGEMRDGRNVVNEIQASEKVYQDFRLEVANPGGHSAKPVHENAIYRLSSALLRISDYEFPINVTEVTREYFAKMAALQSDGRTAADMRAVAQSAPDPAAAERLSRASAHFNALLRTTCVATRLQAGHANNVLPQSAAAVVNCRLVPGEAVAGVRAALADAIDDGAVTIAPIGVTQSSGASPLTPEIMQAVESVTAVMWPDVIVVPVMGVGASDGVFLRNAGIPTYGVEGIFRDVDDDRAHGRDERVGVRQYIDALEFHYRLIKELSSSSQPRMTK